MNMCTHTHTHTHTNVRGRNDFKKTGAHGLWPVTLKVDPSYLVPPGPNISKYLDPRIIYFNFTEMFEPPGTKISELFGPP